MIVLKKSLAINKIFLHAFEENLDIEKVEEIEKQIKKIKEKINNKQENGEI